MSVSFPTKCFLFHKFILLSSQNIQVFRKGCAKFKYPTEQFSELGLTMGFNSAFKGLKFKNTSTASMGRVLLLQNFLKDSSEPVCWYHIW
jgi:hypothetical protein